MSGFEFEQGSVTTDADRAWVRLASLADVHAELGTDEGAERLLLPSEIVGLDRRLSGLGDFAVQKTVPGVFADEEMR